MVTVLQDPFDKHLQKFQAYMPGGRIEVVGVEHLVTAKEEARGALFFTGHLSNWEVSGLPLIQYGIPITFVYRAPNNPYVDQLISRIRGRYITCLLYTSPSPRDLSTSRKPSSA